MKEMAKEDCRKYIHEGKFLTTKYQVINVKKCKEDLFDIHVYRNRIAK